MKQLLCTLLVLGLSTITACDRDERAGPPTLRLGRDECAECGMAIHEERSAAAMLIDRDGRHDYLLFDDIGCMVDAEWSKASELKVLERYARPRGHPALALQDEEAVLVESPLMQADVGQRLGGRAVHETNRDVRLALQGPGDRSKLASHGRDIGRGGINQADADDTVQIEVETGWILGGCVPARGAAGH